MRERSLNLGIDCDDVLVPTARISVEWYNETYHTNIDVAHFYAGRAEEWGVDDMSVASRRVEEHQRTFFENPPMPYPEAIVAVRALARVHKESLITGRADSLSHITEAMADTHFFGCFQRIIHTNYFGETPLSKGAVCREFGIDVLIDDGLMHCESGVEEGGIEAALLLDQPWNQSEVLHPRIIRCRDWTAVRREVAKIARR